MINDIRQRLPVGAINGFVRDTPCALLERLLGMMEASKKAGAEELMLEVSTEFLSLACWATQQQAIEEQAERPAAISTGAKEVVRQEADSDVGYAAGGNKRFGLLTSGN